MNVIDELLRQVTGNIPMSGGSPVAQKCESAAELSLWFRRFAMACREAREIGKPKDEVTP